MPSPIAHLGAGYAIYRYYRQKLPPGPNRFWRAPLQIAMLVGLSMLPDLDVIPAILLRDMKAYHNNISHSLFFGIPVAFLVAGIFHRIYRSNFWLWFWICLLSYDLHVMMDALTAERGVMLFWPVSPDRFTSPVKIFYGLQWGLGWFSPWHLWTIFSELLFAVVVIRLVNYFDRRRAGAHTVVSPEK
jgi:inner membrane protein